MGIIQHVKEEFQVIKERDPAIKSPMEVLLYPSFRVMLSYRRAHKLYLKGHYFWARFLSQRAARKTGIEIHPGATIGKGLFIDHGSGVIIGETAELGDNVTLYQGVTLGGTGKEQGKLVIGVDQDQSSLAPEAVLTSAVKRVDNGVLALCKDGVEGTLKPGSDVNYDITSGAVDVAPTDTLMSDECKAAVAAAKEKILSGEIKVPATTEAFDAAYGSDYYTLDD